MKTYADMRNSLVPSVAQLPVHWEELEFGRVFEMIKRPTRPDDKNVTAFRDGEVTLRENRRTDGFTEADKEIGYQGIEPGDLVIHQMDAFAGAIGVSDSRGKSTPVYTVCVPRSEAIPHYFAHVMRVIAKAGYIESLAKGIRERSTDFRWNDSKRVEIPVPSVEEQRAIADFLDRETAEIDAFIADQERLIELLTERRTATITHAVTKGLDPSVPMRDSGIPWLRGMQTPNHWQEMKMSHLLFLRSGDAITAQSIEPEGAYAVYGGGGFRGFTDSFNVDGDHVLVGRQGALCGNVKRASGKFFASEHALVAHPRTSFSIDWLQALFEIMNLGQYSQSAAQPGVSAEVLMRLKLPVPPREIQNQIGVFLREVEHEIRGLIVDAKKAIELSKERRAALISAAVTGQIDVRAHA